MSKLTKPIVLLILDGFGHRLEGDDNSVLLANTPNLDRLKAQYAYGTIDASERMVGLPAGQFGNSEVGHLNINAIVVRDMVDLHNRLLQSNKFPVYNAEYYKVLPFVVELRNKGEKNISEIETCLDALYGIMMLRMQQKEISPDTEHAIKEITTFIGLLSDYYIKDETEGLDFGEE